jgi:dTDP-4-amino-4,6-dideoxygalactose transaminase
MTERGRFRIRFQAPEIPPSVETERYFQRSRDSRWFSNRGPCQELLEVRIAAELGGDVHVVPVANATLGLMVAIRALAGVAGDRRHVLVPSYTFIATVSAIQWAGFEPLFVDVDPDGWHLKPDAVDTAVATYADSIALIMACSTFGTPHPRATLERLQLAATRIPVPLLVDSAAGFGSTVPDHARPSCDGDLDVYSFHATKPFAIGEGGLVVAHEKALADRVASLVNFGFDANRDVGGVIGLNAKMDEWHCATALAVLDSFAEVVAARQTRSARVKAAVAGHGFASQAGSETASNQFVAVLAPTPEVRAACLRLGTERGIEIRAYYETPLHLTTALRRCTRADDLVVTNDLAGRALSLPLANDTSDAHLDEVIGVCIDAARSISG